MPYVTDTAMAHLAVALTAAKAALDARPDRPEFTALIGAGQACLTEPSCAQDPRIIAFAVVHHCAELEGIPVLGVSTDLDGIGISLCPYVTEDGITRPIDPARGRSYLLRLTGQAPESENLIVSDAGSALWLDGTMEIHGTRFALAVATEGSER
jgi:hypothetical protein